MATAIAPLFYVRRAAQFSHEATAFIADPASFARGAIVTLTWAVADATLVVIDQGIDV